MKPKLVKESLLIEQVSNFRPGKMTWEGKEYFITKVEPFNDKIDLIYIGPDTIINSNRLEKAGAKMIEIGAVSPDDEKKGRGIIEKARERMRNSAAFLVEKPPTEKGAVELENWRDEKGEGIYDKDFILRTKDGGGNLVAYRDILLLGKEIINDLKSDYSKANTGGYFDARPITFWRWKRLSMERKLSSKGDE